MEARGWLVVLLVAAAGGDAAAGEATSTPQPARDGRGACRDVSLLELARAPILVALYASPGWGRPDASKLDSTGAYGANVAFSRGETDQWFIEEQRRGADAIEAGLDANDPAAIEAGLRLFDWGFGRQRDDGSFAGTKDPFHSTSFFVEAVARGLTLLQEAHHPRAAALTSRYLPRLHAAARWMTSARVEADGRRGNEPYTHRRFLVAAALGLTARLTGDPSLAERAASFAREGLSLQVPEGFNPEKGGYDVNYNAAGLVFAAHYDTTLSCARDGALKERLARMLERSLRWQMQKVTPEGEIVTTGSTRVGLERTREKKIKTPAYGEISRAFALGALITGQPDFAAVARRIAERRWHVHFVTRKIWRAARWV